MPILLIFIALPFAMLLSILMVKVGRFFQMRIQFLHDPVYVPSLDVAVDRMIQLAQPNKNDLVLDLGSGDGKLIKAFAQIKCRTVGYEIDPFLVLESRRSISKIGLKHAQIKWKSFWSADVSEADIILLFMTASIMEKLELKLQNELKPGAKIISQRFIFPNWKPIKQLGDCYLYIQK